MGNRDKARPGVTSATRAERRSQKLSGPALPPHAAAHPACPHPLGLPSSFCTAQLSPLCDTSPRALDQGGMLALTFLRGWTVNRSHSLAPRTHVTPQTRSAQGGGTLSPTTLAQSTTHATDEAEILLYRGQYM